MQCARYREALSARLDGEPLGTPAAALDTHLARCADCAAWERAAAAVTRRARLAAAPPVPDLTAAVLGALPAELPGVGPAARARLADVALRLGLLAVALVQAGLAWPVLATGPGAMSAPVHVASETGAWNLAVAAAFLAVALAPRLAGGALPFLGTLAALLTSLALRDLAAGHVPVEREIVHVLVLAGVLLVGAVAWRGRRDPVRGRPPCARSWREPDSAAAGSPPPRLAAGRVGPRGSGLRPRHAGGHHPWRGRAAARPA